MQSSAGMFLEDDELCDAPIRQEEGGLGPCPTPTSSPSPSLTTGSPSSSSLEIPPLKWRSLEDIYNNTEQCQFAQIEEPVSFEEAIKSNE